MKLMYLLATSAVVLVMMASCTRHITGWPGGKPNADDTYRPERAKPYPKRVVVFSPHPDDDVILSLIHI